MEEDVVKNIFIKYLQSLGKSPKIKKKNVPGPDVIIEGDAYECKGSDFEKTTLFKQLIANALQYRCIGIVIPWDALDCLFIHQLEALETLIREHPNLERSIEIYIVAQEDNAYFLNRWTPAGLLLLEISRVAYKFAPEYVKLSPVEEEQKIIKFLQNFDGKVREHIRNIVVEKGRNPPNRWEAFNCTLS
jgi:hypothetical protein